MSDQHSESGGNESEASLSEEKSSNGEDFGVVDKHPDRNVPYQDELLAIAAQEHELNFEEDKDAIFPQKRSKQGTRR